MQKTLITTAALLIALPGLGYAENNTTSTTSSTSSPTATSGQAMTTEPSGANTTTPGSHANLRADIMNNLQKAGFSDVRVMPDSFLVHAKDKSGNPVVMFINPDSVTEISALSSRQNATGQNAQTGEQTGEEGLFTSVPHNEDLSSKIVGATIYNTKHQDIGTIKDLAFNGDQLQAYIVGVGGMLGMGDRYVAVNPSAIDVSYDQSSKKWLATMNATTDDLKKAPEYKYSNNS